MKQRTVMTDKECSHEVLSVAVRRSFEPRLTNSKNPLFWGGRQIVRQKNPYTNVYQGISHTVDSHCDVWPLPCAAWMTLGIIFNIPGSQSFTCKAVMTVSYHTTWCKHGHWLWCQISHRIFAGYNFSPCQYNAKLTSSWRTDFPLRWCSACLPRTVWVWPAFILHSVSI